MRPLDEFYRVECLDMKDNNDCEAFDEMFQLYVYGGVEWCFNITSKGLWLFDSLKMYFISIVLNEIILFNTTIFNVEYFFYTTKPRPLCPHCCRIIGKILPLMCFQPLLHISVSIIRQWL